jgi:hypothetical protein
MGQCKLVGGTCVHLQPLCETLLPAGAVAEEYCEAHGLNDLPQCTVENWERMIESFRWLQLQYVVSFHYVARAVGRGQPASLVDGALRPELGYSSLAVRACVSVHPSYQPHGELGPTADVLDVLLAYLLAAHMRVQLLGMEYRRHARQMRRQLMMGIGAGRSPSTPRSGCERPH